MKPTWQQKTLDDAVAAAIADGKTTIKTLAGPHTLRGWLEGGNLAHLDRIRWSYDPAKSRIVSDLSKLAYVCDTDELGSWVFPVS